MQNRKPLFTSLRSYPLEYTTRSPQRLLPSLLPMAVKMDQNGIAVVEQGVYNVPDIPIKDLLDAIPLVLFVLYPAGTKLCNQLANTVSSVLL
jgi:hypothetical protein